MSETALTTASVANLAYALDTFYLLVMGALVMWMAAGFTMLEAGLVRAKNTTEILTKNISLYSVACLAYLVGGYAIMYPGDAGGGVFYGLTNLFSAFPGAADHQDATTGSYSRSADFFFQMVFVATAMSIVSGAVAERMKLWSFLLFAVFMSMFIYPIQGFWKWGGGWLDQLGFQDFAGSGVVHLCGAAAALAGVLTLGPRLGKYRKDGAAVAIPGCNLPLATIGMLILWLGWLGFNGGSELKISSVASANNVALILTNTNMAAAGGLVAALLTARLWFGKADLTMTINGALAGLVAITADPVSPGPVLAAFIGGCGGILAVASIIALEKLRIDDPVGALSVHGVVGAWGLVAVLFSSDTALWWAQLVGIVAIAAWTFMTSLVVWRLIRAVFGIRVERNDELAGIDLAECGQVAYPEFVPASPVSGGNFRPDHAFATNREDTPEPPVLASEIAKKSK